jgi:hypothetical protein
VPGEGLPAIIQGSNEWLPILVHGETFLPVEIIGLELNLCRFPNDAFHMSRFLGQDTGVIKMDVVRQVYHAFQP